METQRTQTFLRRHPQWGRTLFTAILVIVGVSVAQVHENTSSHTHAAAKSPSILPVTNHPDIRAHHQILLSDTLHSLPLPCQKTLQNLYVRYDRPKERGLAGKGTIILNGNVRDGELRALFIHEFGHITDLGCLTGTSDSRPSLFHDGPEQIFHNDPSVGFYGISWLQETTQKPETTREDFVSGYAAKDAFEDFAETFAYFALQPEAFRQRAQGNIALQKKLLWMEKEIFQSKETLASGKTWNGSLPWDVTKIPYTWHARSQKIVYSPHASATHHRRTVDSQ